MKNESSSSRKRLYEQYEESLFRLVMHDIAEEEGGKFFEENAELRNDAQNQPSPKLIQAFEQLLNKHIRKSKLQTRKAKLSRFTNKFAILIIAFVLVIFTSIMTVEAIRIQVLNFFIEVKDQYTTLELKPEPKINNSIVPSENWSGCYMPSYIPEGYTIVQETNTESIKFLTYENPEGKVIYYSQFDSSNSVNVDTENAFVENIKIHDMDGLLIVKGDSTSIAWSDQINIFTLHTTLAKDEALLIANSVEIVQ